MLSWTDLVQVLCQRSTQPGACPPWCVASRPGRQATRSAGSAYQDPTGRWCRHVVTGADRCRHVGTADGACGHMTSRARRRIMAPQTLARRPHSTMAPLPALALGRPPQCPHAGRHRHVHHTVCWLAQYWDTRTMTGRTWSARQVSGRRRWTTRPSPLGALVSWTRLAEGESIMTGGDALVCVIEDDAPLRASLTHLLRSVGLRGAACTSTWSRG
jgi:hypothetical protein